MTESPKDKKDETGSLTSLLGQPFSKEKEESLDEYLKRNPISIQIQPRRPRWYEEDKD